LIVLTLTPNCLPNFSALTRGTACPAALIVCTWLTSSFLFSRFTILPRRFMVRPPACHWVSGNRRFSCKGFPRQWLGSAATGEVCHGQS
jgi:hypothetical protein